MAEDEHAVLVDERGREREAWGGEVEVRREEKDWSASESHAH